MEGKKKEIRRKEREGRVKGGKKGGRKRNKAKEEEGRKGMNRRKTMFQ